MTADDRTSRLRLGAFTLDCADNTLSDGVRSTRLPLRLAELLRRLAAEPGQVVRRETLIDDVWARRQVNDEVLSRAIADLRQALGDDARAPRYIETLPKIGYRWVADVADADAGAVADDDGEAAARDAAVSIAPAGRPGRRHWALLAASLVVLAAAGWLATRPSPGERGGELSAASAVVDPLSLANLARARPFTSGPGQARRPRFSPDGRWVIYARVDAEGSHLRLRAVDGTEDRVLVESTDSDAGCGVVSPDGGTLAWLRHSATGCELVHRPLLGGPVRSLARCDAGAAGCPDWSPDGRQLLLDGADGLREIAFPGGEARRLSLPDADQRDLMPRYSPDAAQIVFWRGDSDGRRLWRMARDGSQPAPMDAQAHMGFGHAFSAAGDLLVADDRFGQRALSRLSMHSGEALLLGGSGARHPDIAGDGGIVFEVAHYDANLWRIDLGERQRAPRRLTDSSRYDSQPAYSPDSQWLAFASNRDGREGIYLMPAQGGEARKLPLDPALRWTSPAWSPDGARLLLLRYDDAGVRMCLHELPRAHTHCPDSLGGRFHAGFFLDAETVGAIDVDAQAPVLWRLSLVGAPARTVDAAGSVARCRATAQWLVCQQPGQAALWVQDRRSGVQRHLPTGDGDQRPGNWDLAGDAIHIALAAPDAGEPGLYRIGLADDARERLHDWLPTAIGAALAVAPDQSALIMVRTDGFASDLMYVPPPGE